MKDISDTLKYKGTEYKLVFDFNVMEEIQDKFGTFNAWVQEAYGKETGEPSMKALSFAIASMINEGIEIENEEKGIDGKPITTRQANRILTQLAQEDGLNGVVQNIDDLMSKSLQGGESSKNE